jgi:hypothetical protein
MTLKPRSSLFSLLFLFALLNSLIFLAYRLAFIGSVVQGAGGGDIFRILLYGFRLDAALLALESAILVLVALWTRWMTPRRFCKWLAALTYVHAVVSLSNYLFFQERNQHMWEMFLANIAQPKEIYIAVAPLLFHQPLLLAVAAVVSAGFFFLGFRYGRRFSADPLEMRNALGSRRGATLFVLALFLLNLEPVRMKSTDWALGWHPAVAASRYYMRWDDYFHNQAVVNPVHDFITSSLPASLKSHTRFVLPREEALKIARALLGVPGGDGPYALLREIRSDVDLGIENVVLIQVEGLSESLVQHDMEGRAVMPFLRSLAREALYFSNFFQSFDSTDGSVFSIVTGFPETFVERQATDFLSYDVGGPYASLSRILGGRGDYQHLFFQAFRHRYADYVGFLKNQNHRTYDLEYFEGRLKDKPAANTGNTLGVFDGVFLQETAQVLAGMPKKFTAYLIMATTHSPWTVPEDFGKIFENRRLNTFHYVDRSLEAFMETMKKQLPRFDRTLFIIVGDHTSYTYQRDFLERIRVPLLVYSPRLAGMKSRWQKAQETPGSHLDIVPTILALLGGRHCYSGMGKSLLSSEAAGRGVISGSRKNGYYLKDGFVLRHAPYPDETQLYATVNGQVAQEDVSRQHPDIFERMKREYFALYETSKRVTREKKVFPVDNPEACKLHG